MVGESIKEKYQNSGIQLQEKGYNCCQSTVGALSEVFGESAETAIRFASKFGGGIAQSGNLCGAVTGGLMVIGLAGTRVPETEESKEYYKQIQDEFMRRFACSHEGRLCCKDLLGIDLRSEENRRIARENRVFEEKCYAYVREAIGLLVELLNITD